MRKEIEARITNQSETKFNIKRVNNLKLRKNYSQKRLVFTRGGIFLSYL